MAYHPILKNALLAPRTREYASMHAHARTQAPEYYDEIQAHIQAQLMGDAAGGAGAGAAAKGASPSDFWYDVGGWVVLGAVIVGTLVLARSSAKA